MRSGQVLLILLTLQFADRDCEGSIRGPADLPSHLPGLWKVSLCSCPIHNWIRFESVETGEVHTLGRYTKGFGGVLDWRTCRRVWPAAPACGVIWDMDLKFEYGLTARTRVLRVCYVRNPPVFRGARNGFGHWGIRMNCTTYARDAWCFYSGEWLDLPPISCPHSLDKSAGY